MLVRWSADEDGLFRIVLNGRLVYNFRGRTLAAGGSDEISERFSVLRFAGLGLHRAPSTLWLDDVIRSPDPADIEKSYRFDRTSLGVQ